MKHIVTILGCLISFLTYPATILQEQTAAAGVFNAPYLKGQSFLAEDPILYSIGVSLQVFNPMHADTTVNLSLFSGRGTDGFLIAQRSVTSMDEREPWEVVWMDFNVAGVEVTPGETYTFIVQSPTPYWGAQYSQFSFPDGRVPDFLADRVNYTGGEMLTERGFVPYLDMTFRVVPIPEPSTVAMLLVGMCLVCGRKRIVPRRCRG